MESVVWAATNRVRYFLSLEWLPWRKRWRKKELQEATRKRLLSYVGKLHTFDDWYEHTVLDAYFLALDKDIIAAFMRDTFPKEMERKEKEFEKKVRAIY